MRCSLFTHTHISLNLSCSALFILLPAYYLYGYRQGNLIVPVERKKEPGVSTSFSPSSHLEAKIYGSSKHSLRNDICILSHCHIFVQRRVASGSQEGKYIYTQMNEEEGEEEEKIVRKGEGERREERGRGRKEKKRLLRFNVHKNLPKYNPQGKG
ncbi:hypothetical protein GGI43DRAFT_25018 [Trichoderma evansii]